jgi:hypothetical protein
MWLHILKRFTAWCCWRRKYCHGFSCTEILATRLTNVFFYTVYRYTLSCQLNNLCIHDWVRRCVSSEQEYYITVKYSTYLWYNILVRKGWLVEKHASITQYGTTAQGKFPISLHWFLIWFLIWDFQSRCTDWNKTISQRRSRGKYLSFIDPERGGYHHWGKYRRIPRAEGL